MPRPRRRGRSAIAAVLAAVVLLGGCGGEDVQPLPDLGAPEPVPLSERWDRIVACMAGLGYAAEVTDDGRGMRTVPLPPEEAERRDEASRACQARYPQLPEGPQVGPPASEPATTASPGLG
jgi:hypothetical protein